MPRTLLCVNVSHVAELRAARGGSGPDPVEAAAICAKTGCNSIATRLYEDRRHIQDGDVFAIRKAVTGKFNLEMGNFGDALRIFTFFLLTIMNER